MNIEDLVKLPPGTEEEFLEDIANMLNFIEDDLDKEMIEHTKTVATAYLMAPEGVMKPKNLDEMYQGLYEGYAEGKTTSINEMFISSIVDFFEHVKKFKGKRDYNVSQAYA